LVLKVTAEHIDINIEDTIALLFYVSI